MGRYRINLLTAETLAQAKLAAGQATVDQAFIGHVAGVAAAASATALAAALEQATDATELTTGFTQPDMARNLTVTGKVNTAGAQVETATVAGAVDADGAGDVSVVITAAGMTNSPKTIAVAVANADDAAAVAGKIRTALGLDADVTAVFTVGGATDKVILTKKVAGVDDPTLNIAIDNGTCTGLTAAPTSANTTAGKAKSTGDVVITGTNAAGEAITETIALNGTTEVLGTKAFKTIAKVTLPPAINVGDTIKLGVGSKLGLGHKLAHNTVLKAYHNNTLEATEPTVAVSATAVEANTALLNTALNGKAIDIYYMV